MLLFVRAYLRSRVRECELRAIRVCVGVRSYKCMSSYIRSRMRVFVSACVCSCTCECACVRAYMLVCVFSYICVRVCTCGCVCSFVRAFPCACVRVFVRA